MSNCPATRGAVGIAGLLLGALEGGFPEGITEVTGGDREVAKRKEDGPFQVNAAQ